jgi:hypothetical protein
MKAATSDMGQSRPNWAVGTMSGLTPSATELRTSLMVRWVPQPDSCTATTASYSMTSSVGERRVGNSIPSDLAALGLMTNSKFVG